MSDVSQPDSRADDSRSPLRYRWQWVQKSLRQTAAFVGHHRRESAAVVVLLMMLSSVVQPEEGQSKEDSQEAQQIARMLEEFSSVDFPDFRHSETPAPTAHTIPTATNNHTTTTSPEIPIIPTVPQTDQVPETPGVSAPIDFAAAIPDSRRPQAAETLSHNALPETGRLTPSLPGIRLAGRIEPIRR